MRSQRVPVYWICGTSNELDWRWAKVHKKGALLHPSLFSTFWTLKWREAGFQQLNFTTTLCIDLPYKAKEVNHTWKSVLEMHESQKGKPNGCAWSPGSWWFLSPLRLGWWPSNYMQCGKRAAIFRIYSQLTRKGLEISVIFMSVQHQLVLVVQYKKFFRLGFIYTIEVEPKMVKCVTWLDSKEFA